MRVLITGGAGFIGSALVRHLIANTSAQVLNVDKLTYAGNLASLGNASSSPRYQFAKIDICDRAAFQSALMAFRPTAVMHLAAESHVDRSIDGPAAFIETNIVGTYTVLESARKYWSELPAAEKEAFRFHHISTDEVYGSLGKEGLFREDTPYDPHSPYSASKASSDHLVRAWHDTYGLPVLVTNCSNNYGPYQFPEKLIPLMVTHALEGKPLPVYGTGENVRDWLYVDDHVSALWAVVERGVVGETYNIGGRNERTNLQVVHTLCDLFDELRPTSSSFPHRNLIQFVKDRPGHDLRYAIDCTKIQRTLGWAPKETFETGLRKTIEWYLSNRGWCEQAMAGQYEGQRLGLSTNR